jgi:filamentous hemagglutinin
MVDQGFRNVPGSPPPAGESLIDELARQKIKHTPENIIAIAQDTDGRIIFLETGTARAGLQHVIDRHAADFAARTIEEAQIPDLIIAAVTRGKQVGLQGGRPIYEVEFSGKTHHVSVEVGSNGFVVGANPTPRKLIPGPPGS